VKHSSLGASKAYRWMNCPASVRLEEQMPEPPSSKYAMEGTAAHTLGEMCLLEDCDARAHLGVTILVDDREGGSADFEVTTDMADAVQVYLDTIREDQAEMGNCAMNVEQSFDLNWLKNHGRIDRNMFGTNDCCLYQAFGPLRVYDYKHGAGKRVEAEDNPQGLYYALGRMGEDYLECFTSIEVVIVQPRCAHPEGPVRRWEFSPDYLIDWGRNALLPAAVEACKPDCEAVPGDWCHWCRAQPICPALCRAVQEACPFDVVADVVEPPAFGTLTAEQRSKVLTAGDLVKKWIDGLKDYEIAQQQAGAGCPDWKLVAKAGNRAWANDGALAALAEATATAVGDLYNDPKPMSPAQAEKVLKRAGFKAKEAKEKVDELCHRPESVALVSVADPRPALSQECPFEKVGE